MSGRRTIEPALRAVRDAVLELAKVATGEVPRERPGFRLPGALHLYLH